jgi:hypothetical protein
MQDLLWSIGVSERELQCASGLCCAISMQFISGLVNSGADSNTANDSCSTTAKLYKSSATGEAISRPPTVAKCSWYELAGR